MDSMVRWLLLLMDTVVTDFSLWKGARGFACFVIPNDTRDGDADNGVWDGDEHSIPIYGFYKLDSNGTIVPGMLYSGKGLSPGLFKGVLYEQKNVDMMNLFLTEAMPLLENARANNVYV